MEIVIRIGIPDPSSILSCLYCYWPVVAYLISVIIIIRHWRQPDLMNFTAIVVVYLWPVVCLTHSQ
jgi:hypothetical protein